MLKYKVKKMTIDKISIAIWAILYYKLNLEKLMIEKVSKSFS